MICNISLFEDLIDVNKRIIIKEYGDGERVSKGLIALPLQVGTVLIEIVFHVIDLYLPYNILLGRPWIYSISGVPSTFHQYFNILHHGSEITILGDHEPFQYYKRLEDKKSNYYPMNDYVCPTE